MNKEYIGTFNKIFEGLSKTEDDIISINESLEAKNNSLHDRIYKYKVKDSLSDKQEEVLEGLLLEVDELRVDIEKIAGLLVHIGKAMDFFDFDINMMNKKSAKLEQKIEKLKLKNELIRLKNEKYLLYLNSINSNKSMK